MPGLAEHGSPGPDDFWTWREVMYRFLAQLTPDDIEAIATADVGSHKLLVGQGWMTCAPRGVLMSNGLSSMGYSLPAAIVAQLLHPGAPVVCFVGDGGFLMTGGELAVALERGLPLKVILSENGSYGSIRVRQEQAFPGRPSGTSFRNPDLEMIGRAYGFTVSRIRKPSEIGLIGDLIATDGPQFILVETSLDAVLPHRESGIAAS